MQDKKQQLEPDMEQQIGSKLRKEYKTVYCHPAYFSLYAAHIMWNGGTVEAQGEIKFVGRNTNNLRYADDTTFMAESEEELKSLIMRVKEESEKAGLKLNIQKTKIMASSSISSWQIEGEKVEAETDFIFLGSKIPGDGDCSHEINTLSFLEGELWET